MIVYFLGLPARNLDLVLKQFKVAKPHLEFRGFSRQDKAGIVFGDASLYVRDFLTGLQNKLESNGGGTNLPICVIGFFSNNTNVDAELFPHFLFHSCSHNSYFGSKPNEIRVFSNKIFKDALSIVEFFKEVTSIICAKPKELEKLPIFLPIVNFRSAPWFAQFKALFSISSEGLKKSQLRENLSRRLAELSKLAKFGKLNGQAYFIDDRRVFYKTPGREYHGKKRADSQAKDGHNNHCAVGSYIRFGASIPVGFHYDCEFRNNRDRAVRISGCFSDCHGQEVTVNSKMHINLYPNDYVRVPIK